MLNKIIVLCALVIAVNAANTYTTKYDHLDLDEILKNDRIYKKYFECLTRKGKCTPDAKELKDALPDALKSGCSKCTEKQKNGAEKVVKYLLKNKPADYKELENLYDPSGEYKKKHEAFLKERGIKI